MMSLWTVVLLHLLLENASVGTQINGAGLSAMMTYKLLTIVQQTKEELLIPSADFPSISSSPD
jgi:hypothetical protein